MNMIVACNFIGEYEQGVQEAEKMYNLAREQKDDGGMGSALYATGSTYQLQDRLKEAEEAFRECIRLLSTVPAYYNTLTQAYAYLCMVLRGQDRNDEILQLMPDYEKAILDLEKVSGRREPESWANFYTAFMYTYVEIGEYDKAETYAARVESINNNNIGQGDVARVRARIAIGRGNYDRALAEVDSAAAALPDLDYNQNGLRKIKMEILARMGRYDEAMKLFDDILAVNDSIKNVEVNARFDELRTQYEVEKHIAEKERTFHYLLFALGISLVLLLLLAGVFYYNRMMAAKNRKLYERIKEQDRMAEELARIYHAAQEAPAGEDATAGEPSDDAVLPGAAETAATTPPTAVSNEYLLLVARLREFLLSGDRSGTEITRDEMVTALGTNRTTLTEAVRTVTGMTPMEYMRSMKLEEARKMLDEHPELTVESVALSCGFNLSGTFYRLFKKQYGLTPVEYRKMAQAEKK